MCSALVVGDASAVGTCYISIIYCSLTFDLQVPCVNVTEY